MRFADLGSGFLICLILAVFMSPAGGLSQGRKAGKKEVAIFAGGCFWCMEPPYDALEDQGVISTTSGYVGGYSENPTYEEVSDGKTGHREAVQVIFDPDRISYDKLLEVFWRNVDAYDSRGQFCDKGFQYTSAIFYQDTRQKRLAEESKAQLIESGKLKEPIATKILPASIFYPAETYHQDYYKKNPVRYKIYRYNCGRDRRLKELWGSSGH